MAVTVLSGTSGALYYKPAGTTGSFPETGVDTGTDVITTQAYLNLKLVIQFSFQLSTAKPAALVLAPCLLVSRLLPPISSLHTRLPPA
jgi:hypothetical protein